MHWYWFYHSICHFQQWHVYIYPLSIYCISVMQSTFPSLSVTLISLICLQYLYLMTVWSANKRWFTTHCPLTWGVSVFTDDPAVARRRGNIKLLWQVETESWRVQVGAWPNDTVLGKTWDLPRHVCQDIHCKGRNCLQIKETDKFNLNGAASTYAVDVSCFVFVFRIPGLETIRRMQFGECLTRLGMMPL